MGSHDKMRYLPSPSVICLIMAFLLPGCSTVPQLWKAPVLEKQVEYVKQVLNCGPVPQVDGLRLKEIEPVVLPALQDFGAWIDNLPEYLMDHLDHTWFAMSPSDWEDMDSNDIDKRRFAKQQQVVIVFYKSCLDGHEPEVDIPAATE